MPAKHYVGQSVAYTPDDDHGDDPRAGLITTVHGDGRVCLVYWCPERSGWFEAVGVPHFDDSDGDVNEHYFECPGEGDKPAPE